MRFPLIIPPGIDTDDTRFAAKGAWADCDKVRFWRGQPQVIGGWQSMGITLTGVCRGVLAWADLNSSINTAYGTHSALQVLRDGILYTITPVGLAAGNIDGTGGTGYSTGTYSAGDYSEPSAFGALPRTWSLATYGQALIANPRGGRIYQWTNNVASPAVAVTNSPLEVSYVLSPPTRQLMALGCNEEVSGSFNPMAIRFSDIEDITDWTTSPSNNAGEVILEGGGSKIIGGRLIGTYVLVWTDTALFLGTFTGSSAQPWRFDRVGDKCGLIGPNAAVVVGQLAFWLHPNGQFYTYSLGSEPKMIVTAITVDLASNIAVNQQDKIYCSATTEFGEVRWDYPDQRDGIENSRYFSFSILGNGWSRGSMARTAYSDVGPTEYPFGTAYDGTVYLHENGNSADGSPISWYIESADQYLGEGEQITAVNGVWPDFKSQIGAANLEVVLKAYPQAVERTKGPYVMPPNKNRKDFRAQGRIIRLKVSGNSSPTFLRFGKLEFDVEGRGSR